MVGQFSVPRNACALARYNYWLAHNWRTHQTCGFHFPRLPDGASQVRQDHAWFQALSDIRQIPSHPVLFMRQQLGLEATRRKRGGPPKRVMKLGPYILPVSLDKQIRFLISVTWRTKAFFTRLHKVLCGVWAEHMCSQKGRHTAKFTRWWKTLYFKLLSH